LTSLGVRVARIDEDLLQRLAALQAPVLERTLMPVARAADDSVLWIAAAAVIAAAREPPREKGSRSGHRNLGREQLDRQSSGQATQLPYPPRPETGTCATPNPAQGLVQLPLRSHRASAVAFAIVASDAHKALTAALTGPGRCCRAVPSIHRHALSQRRHCRRRTGCRCRHDSSPLHSPRQKCDLAAWSQCPNPRAAAGPESHCGQLRRQYRADLHNARRDLLERW